LGQVARKGRAVYGFTGAGKSPNIAGLEGFAIAITVRNYALLSPPIMPTISLFPTHVYAAPLLRPGSGSGLAAFNRLLLRECLQLADDDLAGQRWSKKNYPGGFTSYGSASRMQQLSPTFAKLEKQINRHVVRYVRELELDIDPKRLAMTDCWVNIMPTGVTHGLHLHPTSTLSGTYYVQTPARSSALKVEDPRLDRFMAAPSRKVDSRPENRPWYSIPAKVGNLVIFESWLRHEVPANQSAIPRISISFNYHWC